jgi:hypothetical protein
LWRGSDDNNRINAKAAWNMVTRAKEDGGLGILDLKTQNEALLLKHLHKFSTELIFHGFFWFGRCITPMENYQVIPRRDLSGGEIF